MSRRAEPTTVTAAVLRRWPLPRPEGDKEDRGRTVVVGGSDQTPGAAMLAAEAAIRAGAGKLQVATVASLAPYVAIALPEALVRPLSSTTRGTSRWRPRTTSWRSPTTRPRS